MRRQISAFIFRAIIFLAMHALQLLIEVSIWGTGQRGYLLPADESDKFMKKTFQIQSLKNQIEKVRLTDNSRFENKTIIIYSDSSSSVPYVYEFIRSNYIILLGPSNIYSLTHSSHRKHRISLPLQSSPALKKIRRKSRPEMHSVRKMVIKNIVGARITLLEYSQN